MLLCLAYCAQSLTLARGFCYVCWNSLKENQSIDVNIVMRSVDVSRCAGDIGKPSVNSTKRRVCGIGRRNVFEAVASRGVGDLRFAMNLVQTKGEVLMSSMVGCVTDLGNKDCDDLRACFVFEHFGGCLRDKSACSWLCKSDGAAAPELEPFVLA